MSYKLDQNKYNTCNKLFTCKQFRWIIGVKVWDFYWKYLYDIAYIHNRGEKLKASNNKSSKIEKKTRYNLLNLIFEKTKLVLSIYTSIYNYNLE